MLSDIVQNHLDFIAFILALIAERFFPLVSWYHPNTVLTIAVLSAIGNAVYKSKEPKSYQFLAAILASTLILSVITLIIVVLLLEVCFLP